MLFCFQYWILPSHLPSISWRMELFCFIFLENKPLIPARYSWGSCRLNSIGEGIWWPNLSLKTDMDPQSLLLPFKLFDASNFRDVLGLSSSHCPSCNSFLLSLADTCSPSFLCSGIIPLTLYVFSPLR